MPAKTVGGTVKSLASRAAGAARSGATSGKGRTAAQTKKFSLLWWINWGIVGIALGFIFPSVTTLTAVADGRDGVGQYIYAILGGAAQGAILGFAQAFALRKTVVALPMLRWILATSFGGILAWGIGMIPGSFLALDGTNPAGAIVLVAFGVVAICSMPVAQWFVLRTTKLGKIGRVWRWIPITAVAWIVGIAWLLLASPLVQDGTQLMTLIGLYTVAGFLMVLTVAVITGIGMRWMLGGKALSRPRLPSRASSRLSPRAKVIPSRTP